MECTSNILNSLHVSLFNQVPDSKTDFYVDNCSLILNYPCTNYDNCTEYQLTLYPGIYKLEAYGASGGFLSKCLPTSKKTSNNQCVSSEYVSFFKGNSQCVTGCSASGSGGYTAGIITLEKITKVYIAIGGMGFYHEGNCKISDKTDPQCYFPGGYNGGGGGLMYSAGSSSGGGATDFRFDKNDLFHRVLVAGAGGGSDDYTDKDGFGSSGGGLNGQAPWINNKLQTNYYASQTSGFSFGFGERANSQGSKNQNGITKPGESNDLGGAGGGWFGGFASHHNDGGGGGGSSFLLTKNALIPTEEIIVYNSTYDEIDRGYYAFSDKSKYLFIEPQFGEGVWYGNGKAIITPLDFSFFYKQKITCKRKQIISKSLFLINILIVK